MGTYKGIKGYTVQKLASDPTASATIGQLFYNSGDNDFKFSQEGTGAYSAGGLLNESEKAAGATHAGTQSAMICMCGQIPPNAPKDNNEQYDGSSWTEIADCQNERRSANSSGTVAGAWLAGGVSSAGSGWAKCETWDGTSWTEVNALNTYKQSGASCGTATAGLATSYTSETWDGTCWTEVGDFQTNRGVAAGAGTQTAALAAGGNPNPTGEKVESWNGSSWSEVNGLNTPRQGIGAMGLQTNAVLGGGVKEPSTFYGNTEVWDGTCFSEGADLTLARQVVQGSGGPATAGLLFGGHFQTTASAEFTNQTEEWNAPNYSIKTITTS